MGISKAWHIKLPKDLAPPSVFRLSKAIQHEEYVPKSQSKHETQTLRISWNLTNTPGHPTVTYMKRDILHNYGISVSSFTPAVHNYSFIVFYRITLMSMYILTQWLPTLCQLSTMNSINWYILFYKIIY